MEVKINDVLANILSAEIDKYLPDTLSNEPSGTDIKSLAEIAEQDNYLIDRPLMIIISKNLEVGLSLHSARGRWGRLGLNVVDAST